MMEEAAGGVCMVCGHEKQVGLRIIDGFICDTCEVELVQTDVQDEKYPFFIHQLKQIWFQNQL